MADDARPDGWLTPAQVRAHARVLGLVWHTVERAIHDGFVAGPRIRGRGQGAGTESQYPPEIIHHLSSLAPARRPVRRGPGRALLLHRLWWDGKRPDLFPAWQTDRLDERRADWRAWEAAKAQAPDQREDDVAAWAEVYFGARSWPYRKRVRHAADHEALAEMIVNLNLFGALPKETAVDVRVDLGRKLTRGQLLERGVGLTAARAAGMVPGPPGEAVAEQLGQMPSPGILYVALRRLTPPQAAGLRDGLEAVRQRRSGPDNPASQLPPFREAPRLAGVALATIAALDLAADTRPPEPVTCAICSANFAASAVEHLVTCPGCGQVFEVTAPPES